MFCVDEAAAESIRRVFDRDAYVAGETIRELDEDVRAEIAEHGIRNTIADLFHCGLAPGMDEIGIKTDAN